MTVDALPIEQRFTLGGVVIAAPWSAAPQTPAISTFLSVAEGIEPVLECEDKPVE